LRRVRRFVGDDEIFLANYADGLSDLPLPELIEYFKASLKIACFVGVKPTASFHRISLRPDGVVSEIEHIARSGSLINGGFFVFRREIFDYIKEGEDLVEEPFHRLMADEQLIAYPYEGFWACMDTFKEKQHLDDLHASGHAPWQVWETGVTVLEGR
jgi:glucose-1-phosphate cytidylyltransferase